MNISQLRSRICFRVFSEEGDDCGSFANVLYHSPVRFYGLMYRKGELFGYVKTSDYSTLEALAAENGFVSEKISERGIYRHIRRYSNRWGMLIGLVLAMLFIAFMSDRVTVIETGGYDNMDEEHIISLLYDAGIYVGAKISDIDLREAERVILSMDKDLAWIGIRHTGSRIVCEVQEIDHAPEMERKNNPCNIVASHDAQIKDIKVYSGMLIPMLNEGVRKGDILISGVVDTKYGRTYYVHSIGEITGEYTEKMTFSQPFDDTETICTGEAEKKAVIFFGRKFVYSSHGGISGEYECDTTVTPVRLGEITFPIYFEQTHYRLMSDSIVRRSEDEAEEMLNERMERYERNILTDCTITDREIKRTADEKGITFTVTYTIEGEIGEERMIFAKYEPDGVNLKTDAVK